MVQTRAENSSESKIAVANGGKVTKAKKKSKCSTMPRRSSARIQALQKAEKELLARQKAEVVVVEEKDNCENAVRAKKRNRNSGGEESVAVEVKAKGFVFSYIARRSSSDFDVWIIFIENKIVKFFLLKFFTTFYN